jgi:hypothetical protein
MGEFKDRVSVSENPLIQAMCWMVVFEAVGEGESACDREGILSR